MTATDLARGLGSSAGTSDDPLEYSGRRNWLLGMTGPMSVQIRYLMFATMLAISVVPVLLFYSWVERSSIQKEIAYVDENHLIIAQNLSAALSRYVVDLKVLFELAVESETFAIKNENFRTALDRFDLCYITIYDSSNKLESRLAGMAGENAELPSPELIADLRKLADEANGEVAISGIREFMGTPHFFVVQKLSNGRIAIGTWNPRYIVALQKSIAFGERGHSMIVDQNGNVVAHPNAEWQASMKNASKLPVVQAMITQNTGVMQFYSPPMDAQMIAGYTFVPETGWGVMVPQPLSELVDKARNVQSAAFVIAAVEIVLAGLIAWWFSNLLARPIQQIATAARKTARGNFNSHVENLPSQTPNELILLADAFNDMVDELDEKATNLKTAYRKAREISRERAQLLDTANRANEAKSQFISIVSHELRTPLTSIKGSLALIESGALGTVDDQLMRLVSIARKNSERLAVMIDDLLDLERLDAGKMQYEFAKVELNSLIKDALEANKGYADLNNVSFKAHLPRNKLFVEGDQNRLMQVLANLMSNAAKFSETGAMIDVSLKKDGLNALISVQDYGIGIPEGSHDKVFEKFAQVDASDGRKVGGSGLGLSIARSIVECHEGDISFVSEEGQGSTFTITLPLHG